MFRRRAAAQQYVDTLQLPDECHDGTSSFRPQLRWVFGKLFFDCPQLLLPGIESAGRIEYFAEYIRNFNGSICMLNCEIYQRGRVILLMHNMLVYSCEPSRLSQNLISFLYRFSIMVYKNEMVISYFHESYFQDRC